MPGNPHQSALPTLKNEIEEILGKKVRTSGDCIFLSAEIQTKTNHTISPNTLRRLFGLVKANYKPSVTTLDILAKYCGFVTLDEFSKFKKNSNHSLSGTECAESLLNYLSTLFKYTPEMKHDDKVFSAFVKVTMIFLKRHPELIDPFQREISKSRNGQEYYFEKSINIDELNSFYGDGLRYYLAENRKPKAQIFGHSLLCLKHWLTENRIGVNLHYNQVMQYNLTKTSHPYLWGRFYATQLMHAEVNNLPVDQLIADAKLCHLLFKKQVLKDHYRLFPYFEFVVSPVLTIMGRATEALYFLDYAKSHYSNKAAEIDSGLYETLELVEALAAFKAGKIETAEKLYFRLHPTRFSYHNKKISTILYLILCEQLNKHTASTQQQLNHLIDQTGFSRLIHFAPAQINGLPTGDYKKEIMPSMQLH